MRRSHSSEERDDFGGLEASQPPKGYSAAQAEEGDQTNPSAAPKKIAIKLFVGQIPKVWEEEQVKSFFQKFGEILDSQIIRTEQNVHRGCAFVKFASLTEADIAIASLNESCFLPGSSAKLQLKWADGEAKRIGLAGYDPRCANKLFVTNIPPNTTHDELISMFSCYGDIQLLYLIKDPRNPDNNRCYVKYLTKEMALLCIKELNRNVKLHNWPNPLEVMFIEQKRAIRAMSMRLVSANHLFRNPVNQSSIYAPKENSQGLTIYYEYFTEEGTPYYFNPKTGNVQWERPTDGTVEPPHQFDGNLVSDMGNRGTTVSAQQQPQVGVQQMDYHGMMPGYHGMVPGYGVAAHPQYMGAMDPAMMQTQMMHTLCEFDHCR